MIKNRFDPFNDRVARDIRNSLSSAFVQSIKGVDITSVEKRASELLDLHQEPVYAKYIENRLKSFKNVIEKVREKQIDNPLYQAVEIWDNRLFFEFHELLEDEWMMATGEQKIILQALIRAAGMYVHLEQGNRKGAEKMAAKSLSALLEHSEHIPIEINFDLLLNKLQSVDPVPPKISLQS